MRVVVGAAWKMADSKPNEAPTEAASSSTSGLDALLERLENSPTPPQPPRKLPFGQQQPPRKLPKFGEGPLPPLALPSNVTIIYTRSAGETDEICADLLARRIALVGLDIEWKVSYEANVTQRKAAVLQIATAGTCYVIQLSSMPHFPAQLQALLEDRSVAKCGNKICNDALKLRRDFGVRTAGLLDLSKLAAKAISDRPWSLADLCEVTLRHSLPKELRMTDWEATRLDDQQIMYAAIDAYASRAIGVTLLRRLTPAQQQGSAGGEDVLLRGAASLLEDTPADPMLNRAALQHAPPAGSVGEGVSKRTLPF